MKRLIVALILLTMATSLGLTQEEPIPPPRPRAQRVGFFAGFTPGWLSVNVGPINDFLRAGKGAALSNNGVFLLGGGGAAYIMVVPNLRVGGMGMGGSISSSVLDNASGIRRDAKLSVGFGGVTVEYAIPVLSRMTVAAGSMIGWGGIDLTLRQSTGGSNTWQSERDFFGSGTSGSATVNNISRKLGSTFFVLVPSLDVEYALVGWVGVRLGVSYVGMMAPAWKVDDTYDLLGVPGDVNGNGLMINAGIFIGTF